MKRTLVLALLLAVPSMAIRPRPSSSDSDSSMSSEESMEVMEKKRVQPEEFVKMQQVQQPQQPKKFFDRPSFDELEAYDQKVQRQNKKMKKDFPVIVEEPLMLEPDVIRPKPKKGKLDEFDEKTFLATLGQMYIEKMDQEAREPEVDRFPGPIGPMGPPPMDYDYFFVPEETPKQANNNGNNNVHVNVNHVQVNSNVVHAPPPPPPKEEKKERLHEEQAPYIPAYHMSEPVTTSKYLYLNFNMTDAVILAVLVAAFAFATKKAYQRCFPKKQVQMAPQLPTTLPPTYSPSHLVVETTSKKVPQ